MGRCAFVRSRWPWQTYHFEFQIAMKSLVTAVLAFYKSSIGKKIVVGATGVAMMLFLVGHLSGNMLMFAGAEAFNDYAHFLQSKKGLVWGARLGLLGAVGLHILATIHLSIQNRQARPAEYQVEAVNRASLSSRTMLWSGLTVLCFVIYHLLHYTVGFSNEFRKEGGDYYFLTKDGDTFHNAYKMVVDGFSCLPVTFFYLLSMILLASHLSHGFSSAFQTLGLTTRKSRPVLATLSWVFAIGICGGFCAVPLAVVFGLVK
jgi:succinate dehydrogenase / fumarate reductase, cytochrome b subunit